MAWKQAFCAALAFIFVFLFVLSSHSAFNVVLMLVSLLLLVIWGQATTCTWSPPCVVERVYSLSFRPAISNCLEAWMWPFKPPFVWPLKSLSPVRSRSTVWLENTKNTWGVLKGFKARINSFLTPFPSSLLPFPNVRLLLWHHTGHCVSEYLCLFV